VAAIFESRTYRAARVGEVIFSYPKLERIAMDVALINRPMWTQPAIAEAAIDQPIWGRRTVYAIAHKHMLVSEFFLPEILGVA